MTPTWEWPSPDAPTCGAAAIDRATGEVVYCRLRRRHSSLEHHWEEIRGDQLRSATWIGGHDLPTYIGEAAR